MCLAALEYDVPLPIFAINFNLRLSFYFQSPLTPLLLGVRRTGRGATSFTGGQAGRTPSTDSGSPSDADMGLQAGAYTRPLLCGTIPYTDKNWRVNYTDFILVLV
jgi:hypothetical protein